MFMNQKDIIPSKLLENYTVVEVLGKGGFGTILEVVDKKTKEKYAAKVIRIDTPEDIKMIDSELLLYKKNLKHKNIVDIHAYFNHNEWHMIVMELGLYSLQKEYEHDKIISKGGNKCKFSQILRILNDILEALIFINDHNIVHRDIKPGNILRFPDCYKIADWGTAFSKTEQEEWEIFQTINIKNIEGVAGTYVYMSPEMVCELEKISAEKIIRINFEKSDVFSLGILILQIYFGYSQKSLMKIREQIIKKDNGLSKELKSDLEKDCPQGFFDLVLSMISFDHESRPRMAEVLKKVKDFQNSDHSSFVLEIDSSRKKKTENDSNSDNSFSDEEKTIDKKVLMKKINESELIEKEKIEKVVSWKFFKLQKQYKYELIKYNKFFDFQVNDNFLRFLNSSTRKYKIISVSGKSGVGKSIFMNMIISLLYKNHKNFNSASYSEIFKVGDGINGTTTGINCNILNLDENQGVIILDLQGNNDHRKEIQWKFLYISLFFFSFFLSDLHFFFYESTNINEINNSDLIGICEKKQKLTEKSKIMDWSQTTELILINNKIKINEKAIQKIKEKHLEEAKSIYPEEIFKGKLYFLLQNDHFDKLNDDMCLDNNTFCNKCQKTQSYYELNEISKMILAGGPEKARSPEEIKTKIYNILMEIQASRYQICYQSNLDIKDERFIEEYLKTVRWVHKIQVERIENFEIKHLLLKLLESSSANPDFLKKIDFFNQMIKTFGIILLIFNDFSRFIDKSLVENGNNILRREEAEYFKTDFIEKLEKEYNNFIEIYKKYNEFCNEKKMINNQCAELKETLKKIYQKLGIEKQEEKKKRKINIFKKIWLSIKELFKINTLLEKFQIFEYILINLSSMDALIKMNEKESDKFELLESTCTLKSIDWLLNNNFFKTMEQLLEKTLDLINYLKKSVEELRIKLSEQGIKKNREILALLPIMQEKIDNFIIENRSDLKVYLN